MKCPKDKKKLIEETIVLDSRDDTKLLRVIGRCEKCGFQKAK